MLSPLPAHWLSKQLVKWYAKQGRQHLPWKNPITPYGVWISEIMLQQTQVATVIPYYHRFMQAFPTVQRLAKASLDEVLSHWSGLGYYARARHLHRSAQHIVTQHRGKFPQQLDALMELPGIGRSTAGAILAQAFKQRAPILDGNVKRVLSRLHCIGESDSEALKQLWRLADHYTPHKDVADYTQAMMDLGATICIRSKPKCDICPLEAKCQAYRLGKQDLYPPKKSKKTLPIRDTLMLVIENPQGAFLLMKRPLHGIWGGLWSLPECQDVKMARSFLRQHFGIKSYSLIEQPPLLHTFTHFQLTIVPLWVILPQLRDPKLSSGFQWVTRASFNQWGIPAPVVKLFNREFVGGLYD